VTVIAAARTSRSVCIGSDSLGTDDGTGVQTDHGSKLLAFEWGSVGYAGSYRPAQAAQDALAETNGVETKRQVAGLVRRLREALVDAGWSGRSRGALPDVGGLSLLLVGRRGAIWVVQSDLSYLRCRKYAAIGSGDALALGAMHALHRNAPAPIMVEAGVRAAMAHQSGCGGRFYHLSFQLK